MGEDVADGRSSRAWLCTANRPAGRPVDCVGTRCYRKELVKQVAPYQKKRWLKRELEWHTAVEFVTRCQIMWTESDNDELLGDTCRTRHRLDGAGRRQTAPELEYIIFDWFTNGRDLYARIRKTFFELHSRYFNRLLQSHGYECDRKIDDNWLVQWCRDVGVSLRMPNKHFTISLADLKQRVLRSCKFLFLVRWFSKLKFKQEMPIASTSDGSRGQRHAGLQARAGSGSQKLYNVPRD